MKQKVLFTSALALIAAVLLCVAAIFAFVPVRAVETSAVLETGKVYESVNGTNRRVYSDVEALNIFSATDGQAGQVNFTFDSTQAEGKAVSILIQNLTADQSVSVGVTLHAGDSDFTLSDGQDYYLLADSLQQKQTAAGAAELPSQGKFQGFYGKLVIPFSAFGTVDAFDGLTLSFENTATIVKVNVYEISLAQQQEGEFVEESSLWSPAIEGRHAVEGYLSTLLSGGEFYIYPGTTGYNNTENYITFSGDVLTEEGYIDTSVYKGIIVSVDLTGTQTSGYFYDAMSIYPAATPTEKMTMAAKLYHIDNNSATPVYKNNNNCGISMNYQGDIYMSFADCGLEENALIMPYISFNSGHKAFSDKSYKMSYRLVAQTCDELYTAQASVANADVAFAKIRFAAGEELTFTVQPQTGYTVDKVYANGTEIVAKEGIYTYVGTDLTVTADILPKEYTVEFFDENGDKLTGDEFELTYNITQGLALPVLPNTSEKIFLGWYDGIGQDAVQVTEIAAGSVGDRKLYAKFTEEDVVSVNVTASAGGMAEVNCISAIAGMDVTLYVKADYGYRIVTVTLNGKNILSELTGGSFTTQAGAENLNFEVQFEKAESYSWTGGNAFFAYDSFSDSQGFMGAVFAQFDAVNVRSKAKSSDASQFGGVTVNTGSVSAAAGDTIKLLYNQLVLGADPGLKIYLKNADSLISPAEGAEYTVVHNDGTRTALTVRDGLIYTGAGEQEAFCGMIELPLNVFGGAQTFDGIVLASGLTEYVRHNFGTVSLVTAEETAVIWNIEDGFEQYVSSESVRELFEVSAMQAGELSVKETSKNVSTTWSYEQYGFDLPEELINEDGVVDLQTSGVKGMLITVTNPSSVYLNYQIGIIDAKYAGQDGHKTNSIAGYRWITASSTKTVYCWDSGRVKEGGATIIPAQFSGKIYVPFSSAAFIKGNNLSEQEPFPTQIMPYIYGGIATGESGATVIIEKIEFITDNSKYIPYDIGIFESNGGTVTSDLDSVGLGGTVTITAIADEGYRIKSGDLYMGDAPAQAIEFDENGNFTFTVTGTVMIDITFEEIVYRINYVLPEGAAHDNPQEYTVLQNVTLSDPVLEGYTFEGWYLSEDYSGEAVNSIPKGSVGDITLYAKMTPIKSGGCSGSSGVAVLSVAAVVFFASVAAIVLRRIRVK